MIDKQLGHPRLWHNGGSVGGTSYLAIYPDQRLVVAVITNLTDAKDLGGERVAEALLDLGRGPR